MIEKMGIIGLYEYNSALLWIELTKDQE